MLNKQMTAAEPVQLCHTLMLDLNGRVSADASKEKRLVVQGLLTNLTVCACVCLNDTMCHTFQQHLQRDLIVEC